MLERETWRWVKVRIHGLLSTDSRLARSFRTTQAPHDRAPDTEE